MINLTDEQLEFFGEDLAEREYEQLMPHMFMTPEQLHVHYQRLEHDTLYFNDNIYAIDSEKFGVPYAPYHINKIVPRMNFNFSEEGRRLRPIWDAYIIFRGGGKSTFGDAHTLQGAIFHHFDFGIIISGSASKAYDQFDSVRYQLECNPILTGTPANKYHAKDFDDALIPRQLLLDSTGGGRKARIKQKSSQNEIILGNKSMLGFVGLELQHGKYTNKVRGKLKRNRRPDYALIDDPQDKWTCDEEHTELLNYWMVNELYKAFQPYRSYCIVNTTLLGEHAWGYVHVLNDPRWNVIQVDCWEDNYYEIKSAWEDNFPAEKLLADKKWHISRGMAHEWNTEMENNVTSASGTIFQREYLKYHDCKEVFVEGRRKYIKTPKYNCDYQLMAGDQERYLTRIIGVCDPALSAKERSSDFAFKVIAIDDHWDYWVLYHFADKGGTDLIKLFKEIFKRSYEFKAECILMESYGYQGLYKQFAHLLQEALKDDPELAEASRIPIIEFKSNKDKHSRIHALQVPFSQGRIMLPLECWYTPSKLSLSATGAMVTSGPVNQTVEFIKQFNSYVGPDKKQWDRLKKDRLDALGQAIEYLYPNAKRKATKAAEESPYAYLYEGQPQEENRKIVNNAYTTGVLR